MTKVDNILNAYANDLEGLTREECLGEKFSAKQCEVLVEALGKGADGIITPEEKTGLEQAGFAKDFIQDLAGTDGKKALQSRVRWLGDHINTKWYRKDYTLDQRRIMIEELINVGPDTKAAIPALIDVLKDEDERTPQENFSNLTQAQLIAALKATEDERLRSTATQALVNIGKDAVPALIVAFKDGNARFYATSALGRIGPDAKAAVPALIEALKSQDLGLRLDAAKALSKIGPETKDSLPALINALKDTDNGVRQYTAEALGKMGRDAVPALIEALKSQDLDLRLSAAKALGEIGPEAKEAVPALTYFALRNKDWGVRVAAAETLGKIGRDATRTLIDALNDEEVCHYAAKALVEIGKDAVPALIEVLKDEKNYWGACARAGDVLGNIGKDAVPALIDALKNESRKVRSRAARALGKIDKQAFFAIPVLEKMAKDDPDPECRYIAQRALDKMMGEIR